jgi:putative MATE family efflux protein
VEDLTTGSLSRHLLRTASFMLVTMLSQTLYLLVDLYWVGRLGKEAVAAVGLAANLSFVVLALSQVLGVGTTTLISHASGARDRARAREVFHQSLWLACVAALVFLIVALPGRRLYVDAFAADALTAALGEEYLRWFVPALALQFVLATMAAALRGTGAFKAPMLVQVMTVVINIVLAPILIFGWGFGVKIGVSGAAIASLVAVASGIAWLSREFVAEEAFLRVRAAEAGPRPAVWRSLVEIGLPAGAEFGLTAVFMFVVYAVSRPFGAAAQAGFGIGMRVVQALFMPIVALGFSVAPVAGQNVGARLASRVRAVFKDASLMAAGYMLAMAGLCNIAPAALIGVFSDDPAVVHVGEEYLRIISLNFVASGLIFVCSSMFQAMGNTIPSLIASFSRIVVIAVPALLMARLPGFELRWVWYLSVVAVLLQLAIVLTLLRREFRVRLDTMPAPPLGESAPAAS